MASRFSQVLLFLVVCVVLCGSTIAEPENEVKQRTRTAPHRNLESSIIDGSGAEAGFDGSEDGLDGLDERKGRSGRVSVSTVALFTLAMAAATGLGAIPFFFVELEPQWAGVCNGMAAGVMLAASFDLVQEGQTYGSGNWVVAGILSGGIFIWLCKKFLEHYGEVSMLDIKGADASKVVLVIGIMTLHSFGEGSGVGVSFAGSKGLSQGLLITLAIAVHNIPEGLAVSMVLASRGVSPQNAMLWSVITSLPQPIVAVPSFICADTFHKFLPFCTGFAAGCMIWMVVAEVLPDGFKVTRQKLVKKFSSLYGPQLTNFQELASLGDSVMLCGDALVAVDFVEATPSQVASAATLAVAFMEALSSVLQSFSHGYSSEDASGFLVSLLFGLGPLLGGIILIAFALAFRFQHSLLTTVAAGIAVVLAVWRPLQLFLSSKMGLFMIFFLLAAGSAFFQLSTSGLLSLARRKRASVNDLQAASFSVSPLTLQSLLACGAIALHALAEGLALGVAAPKAYGLGRHMVLPVSLHGLPRGAAVASCIFGASDTWRGALAAATLTGFAGPSSAIGAILAGIDYSGLDHWMVFACGTLLPSFGSIFSRAVRLDMRRSIYGVVMGAGFACVCLASTRLVCLHTPYCNSAPEAVT